MICIPGLVHVTSPSKSSNAHGVLCDDQPLIGGNEETDDNMAD